MSNELVVAKFGSNLIVHDDFDTKERLGTYAEALLNFHEPEDLIVVSSGAVAIGKHEIASMDKDPFIFTLQQQAQIGGAAIAEAWRAAFKQHGVLSGGLFVTHHELEDTQEGGVLRRLLKINRQQGIVSVINENDALSTSELMQLVTGGDNDGLARHVAETVQADALYLYTKSGGVNDDEGRIIQAVTATNQLAVTAMLETRAVKKDGNGRGGMLSKHTHALRFARDTGNAVIAPAPGNDQDTEKITIYPMDA